MAYPISLSEVKQHLRIDPSTLDDDTYISNIVIPAAVQYCTNYVDPSAFFSDVSTLDASTYCAPQIKYAMLVTSADMFDTDRSSSQLGTLKREPVIQRFLMPYKKIYW